MNNTITTINRTSQQQDNINSTTPIEISFKNVVYELHFFQKKFNNKK